jgi:uncharacterized membrane protein YfcA
MPLPLEVYLVAPLIVLLAYTVFALSGFGSTIIAVPLLAHLLPIKFVIPLIVLLDFAASASIGVRFRSGIDRGELKWILPALLLGVLIGTAILLKTPPQHLVVALGALVASYGCYSVVAKPPRGSAPRWIGLAAGLVGGTMSASIGAGGPLYMMYLSRRISDKSRLRSTISALFVMTTTLRIVLFLFAALFTQDGLLTLALLLAPFIFLGLVIGHRLHVKMSRETLLKFIGALLTLAGLSLIRKGLLF